MADVVTAARSPGAADHRPLSGHDDLVDTVEQHRLLLCIELRSRWAAIGTDLAAICHYALEPAGKLLRPLLLLESAAAAGGDPRRVLPAATGAECGHVASLIHDDIIDGDDLRRGRPSVQHAFGVPAAIIAGDALIFDLFAGLAQCLETGIPGGRIARALEVVARAGIDMCQGQSLEGALCQSRQFDVDSCVKVAELKTAAFFRGACECGAILGGGDAECVAALAAYGGHLGTAFQMWDDLLAFTSDGSTVGKPPTSDVRNGRLTLPVILAHQHSGPYGRDVIEAALSGADDPAESLKALHEIADQTGALTETMRMACDRARAAQNSLLAAPISASRERLGHLCDLAIERSS